MEFTLYPQFNNNNTINILFDIDIHIPYDIIIIIRK